MPYAPVGEYSVLLGTPRTASARARTYCDLFVLLRSDLVSVMQFYPAAAAEIESRTKKKRQTTTKKEENITSLEGARFSTSMNGNRGSRGSVITSSSASASTSNEPPSPTRTLHNKLTKIAGRFSDDAPRPNSISTSAQQRYLNEWKKRMSRHLDEASTFYFYWRWTLFGIALWNALVTPTPTPTDKRMYIPSRAVSYRDRMN